MILVIGERVNNRTLPRKTVLRWKKKWEEHGLALAMMTPAMVSGPTRARLDRLLGSDEKHIINILPPDNRPGTWNQKLAESVALEVVAMAELKSYRYKQILLLGRRTSNLFGVGEFGVVHQLGKSHCMSLPHPSGQNRFWNEHGAAQKVHEWLEAMRQISGYHKA